MMSRDTELYLKGMRLEPDDAEMLEQALVTDPDNLKMRVQLLAYYFNRAQNGGSQARESNVRNIDGTTGDDAHNHARHVIHIIGHHPLDKVSRREWAQLLPTARSDDYEKARTLWLANLMSRPPAGDLFMNAMSFLRSDDPGIVKKLAVEVRKLADAAQYEEELTALEAEIKE